jgi:uncharacterized membrane protein
VQRERAWSSLDETDRVGAWALVALYLFTAAAVAGYATFGLHPRLLATRPEAARFYSTAFTFFPRAQVLLAVGVLGLTLTRRTGTRWLPAFLACYTISLASELSGTTVGLPFGPYHYGDQLGIKWFGHVPLLIPLSWFSMALPSYALARAALPARARDERAGRALIVVSASLVLLAWDVALDPAMSWLTSYWVWGRAGAYYGMPLLNLVGWYVTGLALMAALSWLRVDSWMARLPLRWLAGFYLANLLLPLGMLAAAGLWPAVLLSVAAVSTSVALPSVAASLRWRTVRRSAQGPA